MDDAMKRALDLFPELVKVEQGNKVVHLAESLMSLAERRTWLVGPEGRQKYDRKALFDRLYPIMQQGMPATSPYPLIYKGEFHVKYAWDARGSGYADTVTDDGWKSFSERLDIAEESFRKAYELDRDEPVTCTRMLTVALGKNESRMYMDDWFKRAMAANPDNYDACTKKLYYLEPKWHGSVVDMIAFGQECRRKENWRGGIPLVLTDAYERVAELSGDRVAYLSQEPIWQDISQVYETYLRMYPNMRGTRGRFARLAAETEHWNDAHRHLSALGDDRPTRVFPDAEEYARLRQRAAEEAGASVPPGVLKDLKPADAPPPF